ncbi:hypothetical protein BRARA_H01151 [Brassica rapa]|uniref:Amino acid transporter transmembrane domain-containing protein n=1 Tax=Brassica campestris TaxID=3711 RepID=A0A397YAD3_BRACM|nr:hypothetical protein BRARA_H01151 [Brassica rapa]
MTHTLGVYVSTFITGGKTIKQLLHIMSEDDTVPLTTLQCFLIFSILAIVMSQFPNMNSLFGLSLVGSVMAVAYSTAVWTLPLATTKDTSFDNIFNAIGLIAVAFRGNNLILEIQGTLPSDSKNPSSKTMWRAVMISHVIIAVCMFLVTIVVYWAYGDKYIVVFAMALNLVFETIDALMLIRIYVVDSGWGGPIGNYLKLFEQDYSKRSACFIHLTFIFNCLCSYPINSMPACDNAEMVYITKTQKPCSFFVRMMLRVLLGLVCFFVAVGFSFLPYLAVLIGAVGLLVTSTVLHVVASALRLADKGLHANFFKP